MRFEELTTDDIRQLEPFCDTAILTMGGSDWRPPHLPLGTSWFVLRRLRDMLESSLGGRVLTMPVMNIDVQGEESAIFTVPLTAAVEMMRRGLQGLVERIPIRHLVFLTDNLEAERAFQTAIKEVYPQSSLSTLSFIWWRDGMENQENQSVQPAGEVETSLMLALAKRLVDLEQKSAVQYGASRASEQLGNEYFLQLEHALMAKVQALWNEKNTQTVV